MERVLAHVESVKRGRTSLHDTHGIGGVNGILAGREER
jgi:hypothetical protein